MTTPRETLENLKQTLRSLLGFENNADIENVLDRVYALGRQEALEEALNTLGNDKNGLDEPYLGHAQSLIRSLQSPNTSKQE